MIERESGSAQQTCQVAAVGKCERATARAPDQDIEPPGSWGNWWPEQRGQAQPRSHRLASGQINSVDRQRTKHCALYDTSNRLGVELNSGKRDSKSALRSVESSSALTSRASGSLGILETTTVYPVGIYGVVAEQLTVRDATRYTITGPGRSSMSSRRIGCSATYRSRVGCRLAGQLALGDQVKGSPANGDEAIHVRVVRDLRCNTRVVSTSGGRGATGETAQTWLSTHKGFQHTLCVSTSA